MSRMSGDLTFYGYFRSSAAYRCRIAFNLKGVAPDFVGVHLRKGEQKADAFRALNPQGFVPALRVPEGLITQSLAIIEWLDETHPAPPLLPRDPFLRAKTRAMALAIACDIHPLQNLRVLAHIRSTFGLEQAGVDQWCRRWIEEGLAAYEAMLATDNLVGRFSIGDTPTLADLCLVPQVFSAARFGADISRLSRIAAIVQACEALPAFADAHPTRQPDFEA